MQRDPEKNLQEGNSLNKATNEKKGKFLPEKDRRRTLDGRGETTASEFA